MNMGQVFTRTVKRNPEAIGLVDRDANIKYTYKEWYNRSIDVAAALKAHGIDQGDSIATVMRNRVELSTLYCATQLLGAIFIPYNFRVSEDELMYLINNSSPDMVVISDEVSDIIRSAIDRSNADLELISVDRTQVDATPYESFIEDGDSESFTPTFVDTSQISLILHTGGTTGKPKGVPRSHCNVYIAAISHALQHSWSQRESTLGLMSLSHTMGIHAIAAILVLGGKWVIQRQFSAADTVDLIKTEGITSLYLVPTVFHDLIDADDIDIADLSIVRHISSAGTSMNQASVRAIEEHIDPDTFVNHYGSTEIYTHTVCNWVNDKPGCVGRAGINTAIRIVEPSAFGQFDPTATVDQGNLGEIIVDASSPEAFDGYLSKTADDRSLTDGWFFTGDLGYRDEDSDIFFVGRVDDMIISGGENIYPIEVEAVLESHDIIAEAAVVGRPSNRWNQTVSAFVTLTAAPSEINFETAAMALDDHCYRSGELANFKRPRKYFFVDEFTKSNVGKILRKELQKRNLNIEVYAEIDV